MIILKLLGILLLIVVMLVLIAVIRTVFFIDLIDGNLLISPRKCL